GLAVGIGFALVGIEHLDLVPAHDEEAAVAAILAGALDIYRLQPLYVILRRAELFLADQIACAADHFYVAVLDLPLRLRDLAAVLALAVLHPVGEVLAVEEQDGVGGRAAGLIMRALGSRRDDARVRPLAVVHAPLLAGEIRGIVVAKNRAILALGFGFGRLGVQEQTGSSRQDDDGCSEKTHTGTNWM